MDNGESTSERRIRHLVEDKVRKVSNSSPMQKTIIAAIVTAIVGSGGFCVSELSVRIGDREVHIHAIDEEHE